MNDDKIIFALDNLKKIQQKLILNIITNPHYFDNFTNGSENVSNENINQLLSGNDNCLMLQTHKLIISKIIYKHFFSKNEVPIQKLSKYFFCFNTTEIDSIPIDMRIDNLLSGFRSNEIIKLIECFQINYLTSECVYENESVSFKKSKINFVDKGSVYTDCEIAKKITVATINNRLETGLKVEELSILDFGCGTGRFYFSALEYLHSSLKISKKEIISDHLYAVDVDPIAIDILKIKVFNYLDNPNMEDLESMSKNILNKNMLISTDFPHDDSFLIDYKSHFKKMIANGGPNVIISNPPYFLLKINNKNQNSNLNVYYENLRSRIKDEINYFRNSEEYTYSIEGMLNYYKLSIEKMLNISAPNAELGIICPSTLFADLSSKKLRKVILLENRLRDIEYFPESANLFEGITQSTVIFHLQKSGKTEKIKIKYNGDVLYAPIELIHKSFNENYEIPFINKTGWKILEKISKFDTIKDYECIRNKRGELDLTFHKNHITNKSTRWRLIRGNMISSSEIVDKNKEYVEIDNFIENKSKDYIEYDFNKKRLVCPQISNVSISKRLKFVICEEHDILANSCNYISIDDETYLESLRVILNSLLLNWRFKITNSNNHINNYELDELPLIDFTKNILSDLDDDLEKNINIAKLYGLNKNETTYILKDYFDIEDIEKRW